MKKREYFSHFIFKGSHFEVGIQHGEAFREDIRNHMNMILELAQEIPDCPGRLF